MLKYLHIIMAASAEVWAIEREKMEVLIQFIAIRATGDDAAEDDLARVTNMQARAVAQESGDVGVLPIVGTIAQRMDMMSAMSGGTSTQRIAQDFRTMLNDESIKAIVLDVDSPGGVVSGVPELASEIMHSRGVKPIVAQVNSMASSAAYWLATAADEVVVTPGGRGGSIGVFSIHEDISKALENRGVKRTIIGSHPNKTEGNPYEPLPEAERARIQERVLKTNTMFEKAVAQQRKVPHKTVRDKFGNGLVFGADEMVERGMADRVGTMMETLDRFGVKQNTHAMKSMRAAGERAEARQVILKKLSAGDQLTTRELEEMLKGSFGLSNKEAERAARQCFQAQTQGDPAKRADQPMDVQTLVHDEVRRALSRFHL